jgi:hypothetical protein
LAPPYSRLIERAGKRTGVRTKEGALQDGINSAVRYIKNNFLDGPRQDAYDLVTGTWVPRKDADVPFVDKRPLVTRLVRFKRYQVPGRLIAERYTADAHSPAVFRLCSHPWVGPARVHIRYVCPLKIGHLLSTVLTRFFFLAGYLYPTRAFIFFWFSAAALSFVYITAHGVDYVAWPRLVPLDETINYRVKKAKSRFADPEKWRRESVAEIEMGTRDKQRVD